ncbi:flagellar biosynthetic protein FliR, partial [Mariprofundus ferrooxydans]|nr:flagellar biosynthetic protein FliR [Mariprofundus ferrooxydans]
MLLPMLDMQDVMVALLVLLRVGALVILIPVLGHKLVPAHVKTGLIVLITFLLYPVVSPSVPAISPEPIVFMLLAAQEMILAGILALLA